MKWQTAKDVIIVVVLWLFAISLVYVVYLKVKYLFNI